MFTYDFKLDTGDKNVGTVYLPDEAAADIPVIIYCHGWGGNRELYPTMQCLCERALRENMAVVTFDFYGCGDTGGDYAFFTYNRWKENLSDIVTWVGSQPFSRVSEIGCFSVSSGTTAALRLASVDRRISFIVSVATCVSTHFGMDSGGPAKVFADNAAHLISGGTSKMFGVVFGLDFFVDTISNAPIHSLSQIRCPVLFLQGTADNIYRCTDAKMAYELMTCDKPQTQTAHVLVENGNHGLDNVPEEAIGKMFEWLLPILTA